MHPARPLTIAVLLALPLCAAPTINNPTVTPLTLTVAQPTVVTTSCKIVTTTGDPALLPNGVNLVRLTATGAAVSTIGIMHDDGLNGDAKANDGIFTLQFTFNETAAGQFELQCTAAFQGVLQRVKSQAITLTVNPATGTISTPTLAPTSVPLATPTTVTTTSTITGTPDAGSVMLQRLDSSGRVLAILGTLHDDGLNGDAKANDGIFTLQSTFNEFATGPIPLRISATFNNAVSHVFSPISTLTVTGTPPPTVTITAPAALSYLNISPTTVSGTVSDPTATVIINSIQAPVANGTFSASIPLAEGPNILTATATTPSGSTGSASITVTLDTTPPHVTITSPTDQFVTTASSISVAGNVNDTVVGTVNSQQAQVKVNGIASQVANRTFLAMNVPLNLGSNTIQAVAVDRAGNSATTQITIVRQAPQPGQIQLVSGNNQTATIGTALAAPLIVSLTDATGSPAANKPVIFSVTQNNGMLSVNGGAPAASAMATTNAQGQATVSWKLGMRSGAGSDSVQAYSVGFAGTAVFTATANQGAPGMIVVDSGNNQTGAVNQPLPKPLIAVVVDAGHNRLANVPVTFTVKQGGGSFAGQPSVTVTTDSDGRAAATLTLGFQEGNANNIVTADFPSDTGFAAGFTASGLGPGNPANTVISGLVLDNSNQPIPGITIRAALTNVANSNVGAVQTASTVQTDAKGQFAINPAPVGFVKLLVDGSTATTPGTFPTLDYDMVTVAGQINTVGQSIYLLPIKTNNQLCVTANTGGGTLTIPEAPGFSLTFGPGQVTFPGGSKTGCVSVTVVHPDKVPMVPGFGQQPRFIVTIQPSGALFNPPAPITLPNVDGLVPREVTEMYSFDHDIGSFVAIGTGTVSDDGQAIRSNSGVGVLKAGWHCGGNSSTAGAAAMCGPCAFCDGQECQPNAVQGNCNSACIVGGAGMCTQGYCVPNNGGHFQPPGTPCGSGGNCDHSGNCVFPCVGPNCGSGCSNCNSGNPCIDDSCLNNQCVVTSNGLCQNICTSAGSSCTVMNGGLSVTGTCDANLNCNLCSVPGIATCSCGGGVLGTCSGGQCTACPCSGGPLQFSNLSLTPGSVVFQNHALSASGPGMSFGGIADGCDSGMLELVQIVQPYRVVTFSDNSQLIFSACANGASSCGTWVLDYGGDPISGPGVATSKTANMWSITANDSPSLGTHGVDSLIDQIVVADIFQVYLAFQPSTGARYTLGTAQWLFGAEVDQTANGLGLSTQNPSRLQPTQGAANSMSISYPGGNIASIKWAVSNSSSSNSYANQCQAAFNSSQNCTIQATLSGVLTPVVAFSGRSNTRFGVGETIHLSFSSMPSFTAAQLGGLQWVLVSGTGDLQASTLNDGTATYTAPAVSSTELLQLQYVSGTLRGQGPTYQISIVAPGSAYIKQNPATGVFHTQDTASVGFRADIFLQPADVSFNALLFREGPAQGKCMGAFIDPDFLDPPFCTAHPQTPIPLTIGQCQTSTGCKVIGDPAHTGINDPESYSDTVASQPIVDAIKPFPSLSTYEWDIPWQYMAPGGSWVTFATAVHLASINGRGDAKISKAGSGDICAAYHDKTSNYNGPSNCPAYNIP